MNINFLSLDPSELPAIKISSELSPMINMHLLEFYSITKKMNDLSSDALDAEEKKTIKEKFKLLVDLIQIYKNPNLLKLIKECQEEEENKKLELKLRLELELKKKQNMMIGKDSNYYFIGTNTGTSTNHPSANTIHPSTGVVNPSANTVPSPDTSDEIIGDFWNIDSTKRISFESSSDEMTSIVSEEEFHQDKYDAMIDAAYLSIHEDSILKKNINIERNYICELEGSVSEEPSMV